jgi:5'-3' exonuclease
MTQNAKTILELRALHAQLQTVREEADERAKETFETAQLEQAIADEEALAKLIAEHGPLGQKIEAIHTDMGLIVVTRPHTLKFRRFQDRGKFDTDEISQLIRPCVIYPALPRFDAILEELPASLARVGSAVIALAGHRSESLGKK